MHSLKYLRSVSLVCKNIGILKSEFVVKTQLILKYYSKCLFSYDHGFIIILKTFPKIVEISKLFKSELSAQH